MPRTRRNRGGANAAAQTPMKSLTRTFREVTTITLNNTTGNGDSQYAYYSKYMLPKPSQAMGFKDAQTTFEFWRLKRLRVKAIIGYNNYNQTYNTINQDAIASLMVWTAPDYSINETVSGVSLMSYNNARCNTLSLNGFRTIVNTNCKVNQSNTTPLTILPASTWLDTSKDMSSAEYSGYQLFAMMPGVTATNYLPKITLVTEYVCQFKQPAYQNRPTSFEQDFIGAQLIVIPSSNLPDTREYKVVSYTMEEPDNIIRLERVDGESGSLTYTQDEFYSVYATNTSGKYFGARKSIYTGPEPRKPTGWTMPANSE